MVWDTAFVGNIGSIFFPVTQTTTLTLDKSSSFAAMSPLVICCVLLKLWTKAFVDAMARLSCLAFRSLTIKNSTLSNVRAEAMTMPDIKTWSILLWIEFTRQMTSLDSLI